MVVSGGYEAFHPGLYGNGYTFGEILRPLANSKLFIQTLPTVGLLALWAAHGVLLINTWLLISLRASG